MFDSNYKFSRFSFARLDDIKWSLLTQMLDEKIKFLASNLLRRVCYNHLLLVKAENREKSYSRNFSAVSQDVASIHGVLSLKIESLREF